MKNDIVVKLSNVTIDYKLKRFSIRAVSNCSLDIYNGKITAIVGESGSGKTTLASSIIDCISSPGELVNGTIEFNNGNKHFFINKLSEKEKEIIRWKDISIVFQAAQSALNPIMTVWDHFYETYKIHYPNSSKEEILSRTKDLLKFVKLDVDRVLVSYPHELSGGMKQRVMIAFALLFNPSLIILDEPTTALDVITQHFIFEILKEINKTMGIGMLLLTHDLNVVGKYADYVAVMYAGRIMEYGTVEQVFYNSLHPYTKGLLNATPSLSQENYYLESIPGNPPNLRDLPKGCPFNTRCNKTNEKCFLDEPNINDINGHLFRCHLKKAEK